MTNSKDYQQEAQESKRKQVEDELKRNKDYLESLCNSLPEAIITVDIPDNIDDRTVRYVNKSVEKIFGCEQKELLGKSPVAQYARKEDFINSGKFFKSAISRGTKSIHRELLLKRKNGETFPAELTTTFLRTGGKVTQIISIIRDITERKKAEEALHLRANLLNEATDSIIATDLDGNLIYMNEATCRTRGYSKEEMLNMNLRQLVTPELTSLISGRIKKIRKEGSSYFESDHRRKDGSVFPVEITARTVNLGDDTIILAVIRDFTERKRMEAILQESEEKYRAVFEQAADSIVLIDPETGELVEFNDRAYENLGYTREEFTKLKIPDFDVVESDKKTAEHIEKIVKEGADVFETQHRTKDGWIKDIQVSSRAISIGGKQFVHGIWLDITERKRAQDAIASERNLLQIIMENTDVMLAYFDLDLNFVRVNSSYVRGSSHTIEELIGKYYFDLFPYKENQAIFERVRDTGEPVEYHDTPFEFKAQPWRGITYWDWTLTPVKDASGDVQGLVLSQVETTERRKLDQLKDEFIGLVSHELRTPLTVIMGSLNTILSERPRLSSDDTEQLLQDAALEAEKLSHLLGNLLELSRVQAQQLTLYSEPLMFDVVAQNAVEKIKRQSPGHRFRIELPGGLPIVIADSLRLERILYNLLENAVKYSPHDKEIRVFAKPEDDCLLIGVADQGIGISRNDQAKLFQPFQRLEQSVVNGVKGAGLGLLVCRRLVEAHGGRIWIESKPGRGSTFFFTLPLPGESRA